MTRINNPILPGFRPDPSILRVGKDYYLANSTFEWFPGVALSHSRDLKHWRPIGHVVTRRDQIDLRGRGDSLGLWAPSISHDGERFYCVVCDVRTRIGPIKDMHNLLFTADNITGPWSDPIDIGGCGFDPSLYHGKDGRKWHLNIQWDYRDAHQRFSGITLQPLDPTSLRPTEAPKKIFGKAHLLEGPNLYQRAGWFYLMCAEGGTGWNHGISMARSRVIDGPYESDPQPLLLTTRQSPGCRLQKAGHGELVQTPTGDDYLVHLASRPLYPERRCVLGRETCLQKLHWIDDGWPRLSQGGFEPADFVETNLPEQPWTKASDHEFVGTSLGPEWQSLRVPITEDWASLSARPGWLRLIGRESLHSVFTQSLVARRLESLTAVAETCLDFEPSHYTQSAGLAIYYDTRGYYYCRITHHADYGRILGIVHSDDGIYSETNGTAIEINDWQRVHLRASFATDQVRFAASPNGREWQNVGLPLDLTKLSDDYGSVMRFTGTMIALCCQDLNGSQAYADFCDFRIFL